MLSRLSRWQLRMFVIVTLASLTIMGVYYVQIPAQLGIGRFQVEVALKDASGLYPRSEVTYRGVEVGQVTSIDLQSDGTAIAHAQINNNARIPADSIVLVQSASVIGEQFLNFVPSAGSNPDTVLHNGSQVPASQTVLPTSTDALLTSVDALLKSVPPSALKTTLAELGTAFSGSTGTNLGRIIQDAGSVLTTAKANLKPTVALINDLGPVLQTQAASDANIRSYAASLDSLSSQLAKSDPDLRAILATGPATTSQISATVSRVQTELTPVLNDLAGVGQVLRAYVPGLEHILIVFPAGVQMLGEGVTGNGELAKHYVENNMWFKASFPTACTQGFPEAGKPRSPYDLSLAPLPKDSYCKAPHDSPLVVRGARNDPCPNNPNIRGPYAAICGLIFDRTEVQQNKLLRGNNGAAMMTPGTADLLAPNGTFFLKDPAAVPGPRTWEQLLEMETTW